jgi:AcrR family transcriptional regulator
LTKLTESVIIAIVPRETPTDRLPKLLDAAAAAFVEHGFHRTQMDDVAERLGVSKGTIYRAVDSKDALFAAVIAWSDKPDEIPPLGPSSLGDTASLTASIVADLTTAIAALELTSVVAERRRLPNRAMVGAELERVTVGIHQAMRARRVAIMVLDRCASEIPELAAVWFGDGRYALVDLWEQYLALRADAIVSDVDRAILARTVVEIITTWAVKMPWDAAPRPYPGNTASACGTMVRHLVTGGRR